MTTSPQLAQRQRIAEAMRRGGYVEHVMNGGPELDRVKAYLEAFADTSTDAPRHGVQYPDYPLFPGLRHAPFHAVDELPGARQLEQSFDTILADWKALVDENYMAYTPASMNRLWAVHLLFYMGVDFSGLTGRFERTCALLRSLPRICLDYPWGDALVSEHEAESHLRAHCSIDNLRVRCHIGIRVPRDCEIRVAHETRGWEEGRALLFEDSFEHEVWNRSASRRAILIVDFWHPDLTEVEIEALTAGFRKSCVRRLFAFDRLGAARDAPASLAAHLERQLVLQDEEPLLQRYWPLI